MSSEAYSELRRKIGTRTQVARLLEIAARTVQRREQWGPVPKEAFLALKQLAESSDYADERRPVNKQGNDITVEGESRTKEERRDAGIKGAETRRRRKMERREREQNETRS